MFGLVIGVAIGYIFKPQIEEKLVKFMRYIRDKKHEKDNFKDV